MVHTGMRYLSGMLALALALGGAAAIAAPPVASGTSPKAAAEDLRQGYVHLENDYYKKVEPQVVLSGARDGILRLLKADGINRAQLPPITASSRGEANVQALVTLLNIAANRYGRKVSREQLLYAEMTGLAGSVHDRYTIFLDPQARSMLNESLDGGNFSGVGLSIDIDPVSHYLHVNEVIPGGPSQKAGIQDDDLIVQIDDFKTRGATSLADSKRLRGKVGTKVSLHIRRKGVTLAHPIVITRAIIHDPSVVSKMLPGQIAYVHLTVFGSETGHELSTILDHLDHQGAQAFILDLRDNGGGYLNAAVDVASKFIPSGDVVSVEDRGGLHTQYEVNDTALAQRPLLVLVNGSTASASEITSGAIQDHGVGTLMGTRTFGKGVVQTIFPLPGNAAIKVTTQHYYTPRGRDINKVGIPPDIVVPSTGHPRYGEPATDNQLREAVRFLKKRIAERVARGA